MRFVCLLLLTLTAVASEPLVIVQHADLARTRERLAQSPYGRLLASPALAPARATLNARQQQAIAAALQEQHVSVVPILLAAGFDGHRLLVARPNAAQFRLQAETGSAPALVARMLGDGSPELVLGGPVEAVGVLRAEGRCQFAVGGGTAEWLTPVATEDDGLLRWSAPGLAAEGIAAGVPAALTSLIPAGEAGWRLTENGVRSELRLRAAPAGLIPIDRQVLNRVPRQTGQVIAIGFDAGAWWQAHGDALFAALSAADPAAARNLNLAAAMLGATSLAELATGLRGTFVMATAPQPGFGSLVLGLPRCPTIDRAVQLGLGFMNVAPPEPGRMRLLRLPGLLPAPMGGLPLAGVSMLVDNSHWWLVSHPTIAADLAEGRAETGLSTELAAALAQTPTESAVVALGSPRNLLDALAGPGLFGFAMLGAVDHDAAARAIVQMLRLTQVSTIIGSPEANGWTLRAEGLDGGLSAALPAAGIAAVPVVAGLLLPAIGRARGNANQLGSINNMRNIVTMMVAFADEEGRSPADLTELATWSEGDLPPKIFRSPRAPAGLPEPHYLYLRPTVDLATQPVLIEHPACARDGVLLVSYGVEIRRVREPEASRLWAQAQALVNSEAAKGPGLSPADWEPDEDLGF